jgi:hypothetical protein
VVLVEFYPIAWRRFYCRPTYSPGLLLQFG